MPVVGEGPQKAAIAEEKIIFAWVLPNQASKGFLEDWKVGTGGSPFPGP